MKQKITFLFLLLLSSSSLVFSQTMVNDFESEETGLLNTGGGISSAIVANPNATGENTTANCLEIKRTGAQWWIFQGIDVVDMAISDTDTKFISMMVHFPMQADIGIRLDAPNDDSNGTLIVRPLNAYTEFNQWQQMIFEVKDGPDASSFTLETLFRISFHPDMGFENDPAGQILNDTDAFGYIDQIQILDANPLSTDKFEFQNSISLYPNPAQSSFKVTSRNNVEIQSVSVYTVLGKQINNLSKLDKNHYDISNLASGLYLVKVTDSNGGIASKKLFKK
ncbi:T9SS type A sorting domain-containing protein [uncultured Polaribacter sp.]|uniref:T9SS type A sorting domain-containing protein n=1 Tax=uncultured Polaribacter sp. TaxID=174711 RepID=UPI00260BB65F|nr:T9SS type A sorting domain-containing protein [uncultured Polaribacter sp.]